MKASKGNAGVCARAAENARTQKGRAQDPLDHKNYCNIICTPNVQLGVVRWQKITTGRNQQIGLQTTMEQRIVLYANSALGCMYIATSSSYSCFYPSPASGHVPRLQQPRLCYTCLPDPFSSAPLIIKTLG